MCTHNFISRSRPSLRQALQPVTCMLIPHVLEHLTPEVEICSELKTALVYASFHVSVPINVIRNPSFVKTPTKAMDTAYLDLLSTNATELRDLLQTKQISSVQLVKAYLSQIASHDAALKAFICLAPEQDVISSAALLDRERLDGSVRSQLHGIPVVLKVRKSFESQF